MTKYEKLLVKAEKLGVKIKEIDFGDYEECGYYNNSKILINQNLSEKQKYIILAEELGHHFLTYGDISDQKKVQNRKQERIARNWGYEKIVGIIDIINAFNAGARNKYEMAEYLEITEPFLESAIKYYKEKYGVTFKIDEYIVFFEPNLGILKMF